MRICVVGGGAREVAVARTLKKSPRCKALLAVANHQNPALQVKKSVLVLSSPIAPDRHVLF